MFLVDGLAFEELGIALGVGLPINEGAQPSLRKLDVIASGGIRLENADFCRYGLAGREFNLNARAFLETFLKFSASGPRGEAVHTVTRMTLALYWGRHSII